MLNIISSLKIKQNKTTTIRFLNIQFQESKYYKKLYWIKSRENKVVFCKIINIDQRKIVFNLKKLTYKFQTSFLSTGGIWKSKKYLSIELNPSGRNNSLLNTFYNGLISMIETHEKFDLIIFVNRWIVVYSHCYHPIPLINSLFPTRKM